MIQNLKIIYLLILVFCGEFIFAGETCLSRLRSLDLDYEYNIPTEVPPFLEIENAVDNLYTPNRGDRYLLAPEFPNEESLPFAKIEVTLAIGKEQYKCKNIFDFENYGIGVNSICGPYTLQHSTLPTSLTGGDLWNFSLNRITRISHLKIKENGYILLTSTDGEIYEPSGIVSEEVKKFNRNFIFYDFPKISKYPNYLEGKTSLTKKINLTSSYKSGYFDFYNHCSAKYGSISSLSFQLLAIPIKENYMNYLQKADEDYKSQIKNCNEFFCDMKIVKQVLNSHKLFLSQKDIIPLTLRFDYIVPPNEIDLSF